MKAIPLLEMKNLWGVSEHSGWEHFGVGSSGIFRPEVAKLLDWRYKSKPIPVELFGNTDWSYRVIF